MGNEIHAAIGLAVLTIGILAWAFRSVLVHARQEREATFRLAREAFDHLNSRNSVEAVQATTLREQQTAALEEDRKLASAWQDREAPAPTERRITTDKGDLIYHEPTDGPAYFTRADKPGERYEILAGAGGL